MRNGVGNDGAPFGNRKPLAWYRTQATEVCVATPGEAL
jgi:hypothetical protein